MGLIVLIDFIFLVQLPQSFLNLVQVYVLGLELSNNVRVFSFNM